MYSIIIPTFNEEKTIFQTIQNVKKTLPHSEIIIVDEQSKDNTVKEAQRHEKVRIYSKPFAGLAPAALYGITQASNDECIVMDADGQHPTITLKDFTKQKEDIVIASRYISKGKINKWSHKRKFLSKLGTLLAKKSIPQKVQDPLSGFFKINKKTVQYDISSEGYKVLLSILAANPKAKVKEIPFTFNDRRAGQSKVRPKVAIDFLKTLTKAYTTKYDTFLKFCAVGLTGVLVNTGILYFLTEFAHVFYLLSAVIAIQVSIFSNYTLNRYWTWKTKKKHFFKQYIQFNSISLLALLVNITILYLGTESGLHYLFANLIGIATGTLINFYGNHKWTFK